MDIPTALLTGLISGSVGLGLAFLALNALRKRLVMGMARDLEAILSVPENRERINAAIEQELARYLTLGLKAIHENPKALSPIVQGLMGDVMKALPATGGDSLSEMAGSPLGDMALNALPKKWRGIVALARMFIGSQQDNKHSGQSTGGSGF